MHAFSREVLLFELRLIFFAKSMAVGEKYTQSSVLFMSSSPRVVKRMSFFYTCGPMLHLFYGFSLFGAFLFVLLLFEQCQTK